MTIRNHNVFMSVNMQNLGLYTVKVRKAYLIMINPLLLNLPKTGLAEYSTITDSRCKFAQSANWLKHT